MVSWKRIDELRAEIGDEDFEEILTMFLSEVEESLGRMGNPIGIELLQEELHALRGAALNVGMQKVAMLCGDAEDAIKHGRQTAPDLAPVTEAFQASRKILFENNMISEI